MQQHPSLTADKYHILLSDLYSFKRRSEHKKHTMFLKYTWTLECIFFRCPFYNSIAVIDNNNINTRIVLIIIYYKNNKHSYLMESLKNISITYINTQT